MVKGETAAFLMTNCPEYICCEYALAKIGAVRVPLAVLLANDDHIYMLNKAECTTLIYHQDYTQRVLDMVPQLTSVNQFIRIGEEVGLPQGHESLSAIIASTSGSPDAVAIDPEDLCAIYFTGGTTGKPKGVMLSHRSWTYTYLMEMLELGLNWHENFLDR